MANETLLDIQSFQTKPNQFEAVGSPGAIIYNGYLVEDEKDSRLVGREKYRTYADLLANTTIVAAGVRYFLNLVGKAGWRVEPANDTPEAQRLADLVSDIMNKMTTPWNKVIRRAAMFRFYGFSIQEHTLVRRPDGVVGYLDIEPRPQLTIERWDVDASGTVQGVVQRKPQDQVEVYLPRTKIVYMVDDSLHSDPQGLGLFRHLVKAAHRLERYEILEGWAFERDLRGTPIGRGPLAAIQQAVSAGTMTGADAAALRAPIEAFIQRALKGKDTGIFLESAVYRAGGEAQSPSGTRQWDVELLQGPDQGHDAVAAAIQRINREMARVLGVEGLLLGESGAGSLALARDKTQVFGLIVDSTLTEIKETFEADFLNPLWLMNGWDDDLRPTFKIEQIQYRDIEQVTGALEQLARAGAPLMPDDPAVNEVRTQLGLSEAPEDAGLGLGGVPQPEPDEPEPDEPEPEEPKPEEETPDLEEGAEEVAKRMPAPNQGESQAEFTARFMASEVMMREYPDHKQRLAVALSQFKFKGMTKAQGRVPAGGPAGGQFAGSEGGGGGGGGGGGPKAVDDLPTVDFAGNPSPNGRNVAWRGKVLSEADARDAEAAFKRNISGRTFSETSTGVSGLVATQNGVNKSRLRAIVESGKIESNSEDPINILVRKSGQRVIISGHHRVFAAQLLGQKKVPAHVVRERK